MKHWVPHNPSDEGDDIVEQAAHFFHSLQRSKQVKKKQVALSGMEDAARAFTRAQESESALQFLSSHALLSDTEAFKKFGVLEQATPQAVSWRLCC